MPNTSAQLKGSLFPLSVLQLEDNDLGKLELQLDNKLKQAPSFFFRAPVVINIEKLTDDEIDFRKLKHSIESKDFICVGVCNGTTVQKQQARLAGLATLQQPKHNEPVKVLPKAAARELEKVAIEKPVIEEAPKQATKIVRQNIRSGQQVYAQGGDLVIIGSVGNGAEVIADGSIHIYGKLRGRAIAGAKGDQQSAIFCQSIEAELVSIAGTYWLSEAIQENHWQQSGLIKLEKEQLVVESLPGLNN
ncbi:septum site-determining protein MinC [Psychrobium sp. 1_MG-2023]|uniref:septum site-determining protein MinC n=1 Tax=Psychrobium sp. 1_MG-2023 TaxID=3062624 RepID=UPI000C33A79B|nr:septum site-determining protein MinC [Psychrobium sp. 1_MG-2023]MDP2562198.1 septum site-determining protein MinC [Psychrobium sp. 1_MG-2023]PKF58099.1 septum site-determining protein MinC [Alteromonadales bacterium alter-6D02]